MSCFNCNCCSHMQQLHLTYPAGASAVLHYHECKHAQHPVSPCLARECHISPHLLPPSPFSSHQVPPFGASIALVHGVFAMDFVPGPERYPYDELKGYATVNGITNVLNSTFADFGGSGSGCGVSAGAGMHPV